MGQVCVSVSHGCVYCLKITFPRERRGRGGELRETHTCVSILVSFCLACQVKSLPFSCFVNKNHAGVWMQPLTFSDWAAPYLALILGSLMVARLVPVMVNMVPPLEKRKAKKRALLSRKLRQKTTNTKTNSRGDKSYFACTCMSPTLCLLYIFLVVSKTTHNSADPSVEINVKKCVLSWRQESPPVCALPLTSSPAAAFCLLIHERQFSGNDRNAKALA